jgi:uncharacterized repeat protein (TIGR01451 family)
MTSKQIVSYLITGFAFVAGFAFAAPVYADMCTTQYGGDTNCQPSDLTINKQVRNRDNNDFVENLSASDPTFAPGNDVVYRLIIKNNSGETFNPVEVKDMLPPYITFISGPGSYDAGQNKLTISLDNLTAGETRTVEFTARVKNLADFDGKSSVCVNNYAEVRALNRFDNDTAQVCLQTKVLGTTTLPIAGFNDYLLLLPFAGMGLSGLALLKFKR